MMPSSSTGKLLVLVRFVLGSASWLAPRGSLRLMGLDARTNPHAAYVNRLFGARDAALGAGLLLTRGEARRLWWRIGIACDLLDATAGVVSARNRELPDNSLTKTKLVVAAILGASLGVTALASDDV
jgi:hypothetical protein